VSLVNVRRSIYSHNTLVRPWGRRREEKRSGVIREEKRREEVIREEKRSGYKKKRL